ncbi:36_t:CDS:2 [Paraglomus brasilianum]|uniref:36_t:CDS:1 n=1 Tax=Paraglomus brasilianum TaxID=144538 RepID=A0A9N9EYI8_9GLOM|nr:36_t:CDS:2 [Paraglomus brasilianum]
MDEKIQKNDTDEGRQIAASFILKQKNGREATEFWNLFEKKRELEKQQFNTNIDIQLSTLKVMGTAAVHQEAQLIGRLSNGQDDNLLLSEADNASTANVNSGNYCLNEVDNANLPRDFTEMQDFVYFYECVVKWALLARNVVKSFNEARIEKRPSRLSYAGGLLNMIDP